MADYNKLQQFVEDLAHKGHDLESDQLVVALSNTAINATDAVLADLTEVAYTYCSSRNITTASSGQTTGTYKLVLTDLVLTASGGSIGPFRYVVIYNDTSTGDMLIGYYDYGSSITVLAGETFTIDFDASNGFIQLA